MEKQVPATYSWGKNKDGELSVGLTRDIFHPQVVRGLRGKQLAWISSGGQHSACIDMEGKLYVCGSGLFGKLGIEDLTSTSVLSFTLLKALQGKVVRQVACGDFHTLCLLEDGVVYTWGGNLYKKTGQSPKAARGVTKPGVVTGLQSVRVLYVDCGDFHSAALASDGKVYTWGGGGSSYNKGQCGHGHYNDTEQPSVISAFKNKEIVKISCGGHHTLALSSKNELFAFGNGLFGECGFGEFLNTPTPKLVNFPWVKRPKDDHYGEIVQISAGGHHSLVLTSLGSVFSFGFASHGQLGLHNTTNYCEPQHVGYLRGKYVKTIAAGWHHSLVLTSKGDVWACGYGFFGQLGLGDDESHTTFTHVSSLGNKNITQIYAGGNHSWAVIDSSCPMQENYEPPSPIDELNSSLLSGPKVELSQHESSFLKLPKSEYSLTIVYSDLKCCHRFISYTLKEASLEIGKARAEEYVHEMYLIETGLQHHRIQEDDQILEVINADFQVVCQGGKCFFTCVLVADPLRNEPSLPWVNSKDVKDLTVTKESYQLENINEEIILSEWVRFFISKVGNFCKSVPLFFELRPCGYYNEIN